MSDYTEFVTKTQDEIIHAVKQAQETNLKALSTFGDALAEYASKARSFASPATLPTPTDMITSSFGFAAQLIDLQKNYYVKIAESFASSQKKATEAIAMATKKSDVK
jgi:hypothetical protein